MSPSLGRPGSECRLKFGIFQIPAQTYRQDGFIQSSLSIMEELYASLKEITFTEAEQRCAVVLCLVQNQGQITNRDISNTTGLNMRTIQRVRSKLEESLNPRETISRSRRSQEDSRKARDAEFVEKVRTIIDRSPTRSFVSMGKELGVSDKTVRSCVNEDLKADSIALDHPHRWRPPLGLAAGLCPLPCVKCVHGVAPGALLRRRHQGPMAS